LGASIVSLARFDVDVCIYHMGPDAIELIDQISLECDHIVLENHLYISRGVRASAAIAVQRGNALAILGGYSRAVMRGGYGHVVAA
jgi:hypothetical protein